MRELIFVSPSAIDSVRVAENVCIAKTFFELNEQAGIQRRRTITWNIVPWYIGSSSRIRPANSRDIEDGFRFLDSLFDLLPRLRAIVLVGRKAQRASIHIEKVRPNIRLFMCPHPSPLFVNHSPFNREKILLVLQQLRDYLKDNGCEAGKRR